ncbi:pyridoxal phosphate-dependent aminotransferase family protein [Chitinophaga sp. Mgbs1]|uniref:Pyridoxal phosphate-dependent aminotransferase family protein n=1 Tax=Chitinophaga solisilvae TaxID=1233460 RepID=A0A9Q5GLC5_9BACT|nr:pyridoxal phosphate-dependent aminotransferase family protein [Chitinophaga solisilvae]
MSINSPTGYSDEGMETALSGSTADFVMPPGNNIITRLDNYYRWVELRERLETWQYARIQESRPGPVITARDSYNRKTEGLNFASQDYLGLSAHPEVINAAGEALLRYGPHSAGSPAAIGQTDLVGQLEDKLSELTGMEHVIIYPTGWAAGFGSITGLMNANDHIIMDALSHSCLVAGAGAVVGKNIYKFPHLRHDAVSQILKEIRAADARNGILVVTEGLFSMNADTPDIKALQEICHEYNASLLVDVAHDLGALGPGGTGQIGIQGMKGKVDLVMGSFSKTFASGGGFLATNSAAVKEYMKMYSGSYIFSNAISPVQTASALHAAGIIISREGEILRDRLYELSSHMRNSFTARSCQCSGIPAALVPVMIGRERKARIIHRLLRQKKLAALIVEFPVVPLGEARIRLQLMATHTIDQINLAVDRISESIEEAEELSQITFR